MREKRSDKERERVEQTGTKSGLMGANGSWGVVCAKTKSERKK